MRKTRRLIASTRNRQIRWSRQYVIWIYKKCVPVLSEYLGVIKIVLKNKLEIQSGLLCLF